MYLKIKERDTLTNVMLSMYIQFINAIMNLALLLYTLIDMS